LAFSYKIFSIDKNRTYPYNNSILTCQINKLIGRIDEADISLIKFFLS